MSITLRTQRIATVLMVVTLMTVVVGYGAVATTTMRPPTVVVTFNIERVTADLTERGDAEAKLRDLVSKVEDEGKRRVDAIKKLQESLDEAPEDEKTQLNEQLDQLTLEAMSYSRFVEMRIDNERSLMLRDLYLKIQSAVADISVENGYDLVLISDDDREISISPQSKQPRELQVSEQIRMQRIVFSSDQIDITDQIVTHMNLEWEKKSDQ